MKLLRRFRKAIGLGDAGGALKLYGYAKHTPEGSAITDGAGKVIGRGPRPSCTKIRPGQPGSWISNERCSYNFRVPDAPGQAYDWYSCRGYGEGMALSCRKMKKGPRR